MRQLYNNDFNNPVTPDKSFSNMFLVNNQTENSNNETSETKQNFNNGLMNG